MYGFSKQNCLTSTHAHARTHARTLFFKTGDRPNLFTATFAPWYHWLSGRVLVYHAQGRGFETRPVPIQFFFFFFLFFLALCGATEHAYASGLPAREPDRHGHESLCVSRGDSKKRLHIAARTHSTPGSVCSLPL